MASITEAQRKALVANFRWMYENGKYFGYEEVRPFKLRSKATLTADFKKGITVSDYDCVGFTVEGFYLTGLKDPSGYGFKGDGDTATMLTNLKDHYTDPKKTSLGAVVIFGADLPDDEQHVCVVVGDAGTSNPTLVSHGQPGVKWLSLSEEQTAHSGSTVFLSPGGLG